MINQTMKNLRKAFKGEAMANRRYLAFAKKASEEGFINIARILNAIAEAETIHANNHLKVMGDTKSTLENIENALQGEMDEYTAMYPMFIGQAEKDLDNDALKSFFWANEAEMTHIDLFEKAVKALKNSEDVELNDIYVCSVCGYTIESPAPEICPTCNEANFQLFE